MINAIDVEDREEALSGEKLENDANFEEDAPDGMDGPRSPIKAIRRKCLECSGGSAKEVSICSITICPLHAFRFGRNPFRVKREMSEEQRAAAVERLKNFRVHKQEQALLV